MNNILRVWLPVALFGVLWADLVRQLSYTWGTSEQYAYGWFVPFLALALFWKRWLTRPLVPQPSTINPQPPPWLIALVVMAALALLPIRVVYEINPDWPLPGWLMALVVVGISLYAIFLMGGWSWIRHFAFPVCFILVAVAWPYRIEHGLTQGLMRVVANLTVEVIGWVNIPALQRGNLIEVSTGVVGIDEACSGIRSFQSTLMAGLFLGELYLLKWRRRSLLLVGGVALSFCLNVVRTLILTWQASTAGLSALEKWHDPAGMMIFLVSFACLWAIAGWLKRKTTDYGPRTTDHGLLTTDYGLPVLRSSTAEGGRTTDHRSSSPVVPLSRCPVVLPARYLLAVGCWALLCIGVTEAWYRAHEIKQTTVFHWSVGLPETKQSFQKVELSQRTVKMLAYDIGATAKWQEEDGSEWALYFFRWNPRSVQSVIQSRLHRPDVCLPAAGLRQISDSGVGDFAAGNLKLPFRRYIYESAGQNLYVFFCQWEDGAENQAGLQASKQAGRLQAVLTGRRHLGQQTLEIILAGYDSLEKAEAELRGRLPELIRPDAARKQRVQTTQRTLRT